MSTATDLLYLYWPTETNQEWKGTHHSMITDKSRFLNCWVLKKVYEVFPKSSVNESSVNMVVKLDGYKRCHIIESCLLLGPHCLKVFGIDWNFKLVLTHEIVGNAKVLEFAFASNDFGRIPKGKGHAARIIHHPFGTLVEIDLGYRVQHEPTASSKEQDIT